jgi:hypothetical protein
VAALKASADAFLSKSQLDALLLSLIHTLLREFVGDGDAAEPSA